MKRYPVVILNWNGAGDTIECLRSIRDGDPAAMPIVVDNGSTDDSLARIAAFMQAEGRTVLQGTPAALARRASEIPMAAGVLLAVGENLGFAAGSNLGLKLAAQVEGEAGFDVAVFLNNDTIVEAGALTRIVERLRGDTEWFATLPLIMIDGTDRIWNAGGTVSRLGFRRYHLSERPRSEACVAEIPCTFFTGCCFAVRLSEFSNRDGFTERFFFGEEDFELALWMKDRHLRALCLTDAVVQHKVSASVSRAAPGSQGNRVFVYYLNRFVHMRLRLGWMRWRLWLGFYLPYIAALLWRRHVVPARDLLRFLRTCVRWSAKRDRVTRADFQSIMVSEPW